MKFVFDLDSTITRRELLPLLAREIGMEGKMARLTEQAMCGEIPFEESFRRRVELLNGIPLHRAKEIAASMPLHYEIASFIRENAENCLILTGNLDVWIEDLIRYLGMEGRCLCSKAIVRENKLLGIESILDKTRATRNIPHPFIAVGDGSNDIGMIREADLGIAFAGVRQISPALVRAADQVIKNEKELCEILRRCKNVESL